ncbi:MAG: nucleotidyltransferase family protein [Lachnospiraceae bacterium]|nr:nucleotidyltransferase family protein [Lachnospiraceae bacterium]
MNKEQRLILDVVLKNKSVEKIEEIDGLLEEKLDWCVISGQLMNHRLLGYFYEGLTSNQRDKMPKELRRTTRLLMSKQEEVMKKNYEMYDKLSEKFEKENIRYCALKGLMFCADFYELRERRSNDLDIMLLEEDLGKADKIFREFGFIQSFMKDGEMKEATRKEKICQRLKFHDLVPYVKYEGDSVMKIDINFRFDSENNDIDKEVFDRGVSYYGKNEIEVKGLPFDTNLIFLCIHFYREGRNTIWTKGKRDLLLYKLVDVINMIRVHYDEFIVDKWLTLVKKLHVEEKCYYTFYILDKFYKDEKIEQVLETLTPEDNSYINEVYVEGEDRYIEREKPFVETAFDWVM